MNKTPVTIWVNIIEPGIENNKIIVKKGTFYYNKHNYIIENGVITMEKQNDTENI